ncbi:MAG: leucine-rich repeat domain-containing protein, partial [Oscillospiraceae bacterium]|nr:leucine-rich repeat domain-containing protein [Oscillospiraceae bacterium]
MSELWREKASFKRLEEEWRTKADILPYERLYETLTQAQLQELLRDAKRLHWQVLDLHRCGLEALPPELGNLPDLQFLDLGNGKWKNDKFKQSKENTFSVLPDSFGNLSNLQSLYLGRTPITSLPDSFGNLSNLQTLYLIDTQITSLPDSFGNLSNLQSLYLDNTLITSL